MLMQKELLDTATEIGLEGINTGHHLMHYRGVPCAKAPFDYVLYQMILSEIQPDLIIEIGTNAGGSALYLADIMLLTGKGMIHSIDIEDRVHALPKAHPRIRFFSEGWEAYDTELIKGFETILVIEDSSHTYENTLEVMNKFAPFVSKGSYLIVEDGIVDALGMSEQFNGGPVRSIKEFLSKNIDFFVDMKWSDFFGKNATFNTIGYLKKK